jgi:hypothetical protein
MRGIYAGIALSSDSFVDKKTGELRVSTSVAIGNEVFSVPLNGVAAMTPVFVAGDARKFDGRGYFKEPVQMVERAANDDLASLIGA